MLFRSLSLCYYAGSTYHRLKGLITISSGIEPENYARAVEEITGQLEALQRGEWEDWELEGARQSLLSSLRSVEDSISAMEDFTVGQAVSNGEETVPGLIAAIDAVTPLRVREAAEAVKADTIYFLKGREERA